MVLMTQTVNTIRNKMRSKLSATGLQIVCLLRRNYNLLSTCEVLLYSYLRIETENRARKSTTSNIQIYQLKKLHKIRGTRKKHTARVRSFFVRRWRHDILNSYKSLLPNEDFQNQLFHYFTSCRIIGYFYQHKLWCTSGIYTIPVTRLPFLVFFK